MKSLRCLSVVVLLANVLLQPAEAQQSTAIINGRVSDASGGVIPGVMVTLTGDAVMGSRETVTDERGVYRFTLLPPEKYRLQFELPGFATLIRENIQLTSGFTATVNVELQVAAVADTVTVSGQSPVVDVESSAVAVNFGSELLRNLPNARDMWSALAATPGVQMTRHDVGNYNSGSQSSYRNYGTDGQTIITVDGVIIGDGSGGSGLYLDYGSFAEIQVVGASKGAQIQTSGANINQTVKSGSNNVHGMFFSDYSGKRFQGNNLTPDLVARGYNGINSQDLYSDTNANAGGPFVRDRFWWFTSWRNTYSRIENPLFLKGGCPNADSCTGQPLGTFPFNTTSTEVATPNIAMKNITLKLNFQLTLGNQLSYTGQMSNKLAPFYNAQGQSNTANARYFDTDSSASQHYPGWYQTWKWTSTLSPRSTLDMSVNDYGYTWTQHRRVDEYSRRDLDTQAVRGGFSGLSPGTAAGDSPFVQRRQRWHYNLNFGHTTNNFIGGTHNIAAGYTYNYETDRNRVIGPIGGFTLYYRGGFQTPAFIDTVDSPFDIFNGLRSHAIFFSDRWNITPRLTLNLGVRQDLASPFYPDQEKSGVGPYQVKQTIPGRTLPTIGRLVPRLSLIYDLFGNGKTALKAAYSRYAYNPTYSLAGNVNPIRQTVSRYNWDGILPFDATGKSPVSVTGGPNRNVSPDLELPYTDEFIAGIDQQLMTDVSLRLNFVRKLDYNYYQLYNVAIPFSAYNIPVTGIDPGPNGVVGGSDDRTLTLFSLDPAYVGRNQSLYENRPGVENGYTTLEASLSKRFSQKWQALAGWDYVHRNLRAGVPQDPIALIYNNGQNYWTWTYKVMGSYEAPYSVTLSSIFRASKGEPYGRTLNSPRLNQGVVTVRVEPIGAYFNDTVGILDFRAEKSFTFDERWAKLSVMFDLFNITNSNAVTGVGSLTGPSFESVSQTLTPRIMRLGVRWEF